MQYLQETRGGIVLARTRVASSGGTGIVVCRAQEELPNAPLYTGYIRKSAEYRVHVVLGEVVLIQQKRKENEVEQTADQRLIRNRANGWVFSVNNVTFADEDQRATIERVANDAISALGLDFGAVDLVVSKKDGTPYVLEVNTAPGIESPTLLAAYQGAFNKLRATINYAEPRKNLGSTRRPAKRERTNYRG